MLKTIVGFLFANVVLVLILILAQSVSASSVVSDDQPSLLSEAR